MSLRPAEQLELAIGIARGLEYISSNKLVHLDVAARNCLIAPNNVAKIADFGLAQRFDEGKPYYVMKDALRLSIRWLCPEAMGPPPKKLSEFSDVWSFGVVLWEIVSYGERPFKQFKLHEVQKMVVSGERLQPPAGCAPALYEIMCKCWKTTPSERITFTEAKKLLKELQESAGGRLGLRDLGKHLYDLGAEKESAAAKGGADAKAASPDQGEMELLPTQMEGVEKVLKEYDYPE